jgi:type II secretory pathway component PulF
MDASTFSNIKSLFSKPPGVNKPADVSTDIEKPCSRFAILFGKMTFTPKSRRRLYERLSAPIEAGVRTKDAIQMLYQRAAFKSQTETHAIILRNMLFTIDHGSKPSDGLADFIPLNELLILRAGEEQGDLASAFKRAAKTIDTEVKMKKTVRKALASPSLYLVGLIGVMWYLGTYVGPSLAGVLPMEEWSGRASFIAELSLFVASLWFPVAIILIITLFIVLLFMQKRYTGKARVYLDKIPPFSLYRVEQGATWLTTYSAMLQAGRRMDSTLEELHAVSGKYKNHYLAHRTEQILYEIAHGASDIGNAMERTGTNFPDEELISDLVMQSSLTDFDERVEIIADRWVDNTAENVEAVAKKINMFVFLLIFGFFGMFIFGVVDLNQQLASSVRSY